MRTIVFSSQYKKDVKLARKRNLPEEELNAVVFNLANDIPLAPKYRDHELLNQFKGFRECHIKPDWLLMYRKTSDGTLQILELVRTGSHSDLFG